MAYDRKFCVFKDIPDLIKFIIQGLQPFEKGSTAEVKFKEDYINMNIKKKIGSL